MNVLLIESSRFPRPSLPLAGALRVGGADVQTSSTDALLPAADAYVLLDAAAGELGHALADDLVRRVEAGAGLLVAGGSHGLGHGGGLAGSPLARLLPIDLGAGDDRESAPSGLFLRRRVLHPVFDGLPWDQPPVVTGFHRLAVKPGSDVLLEGVRILALASTTAALAARTVPLLVTAEHGRGQVGVLATDFGGRWSAGLASWGNPIPDGEGDGESVGSAYGRFALHLLTFLAGRDEQRRDPWTAARFPRELARMPRTFEWRLAGAGAFRR